VDESDFLGPMEGVLRQGAVGAQSSSWTDATHPLGSSLRSAVQAESALVRMRLVGAVSPSLQNPFEFEGQRRS